MITLNLRFFGEFRKFLEPREPLISLQVKPGTSVNELKKILIEWFESNVRSFQQSGLVFDSAIGSESEILSGETKLNESASLVVLPPVCGG